MFSPATHPTFILPTSCIGATAITMAAARDANAMFAGYQQHDAQEFLRFFVEHLHDAEAAEVAEATPSLSMVAGQQPPCPPPPGTPPHTPDDGRMERSPRCHPCTGMRLIDATPPTAVSMVEGAAAAAALPRASTVDDIEGVFGGSLTYTTRCRECETESCRREAFHDLSLPVHPQGGRSLTDVSIAECCMQQHECSW